MYTLNEYQEGGKKFPADFFKVRKELPVPFVS